MIVIRPIKPGKPFQSAIFRAEMQRAANVIKADALADFKKTTANWQHKVKFSSKVTIGGTAQGIEIQIATDDPIYRYVDEGTKVRYAVMSKDWKSKTSPNVVGTFPGRGSKLFVNKKIKRPGIKARNFTKHISKTTAAELQRETKNALARFARRTDYEMNQ